MILGMSLATYTLIHVLMSLVGLATGFAVLFGPITGKRLERWTAIFLGTTVATSLTGFAFPAHRLLPSHVVGVLSLVVLTLAIFARYSGAYPRRGFRTYAVCAVVALYLNSFVAIAQSFQKVPALKALAPTESEPPFLVAQLTLLVAFLLLGYLAARRAPIAAAAQAAS